MFGLFKAVYYKIKSIFSARKDKLMNDPQVMREIYDNEIKKRKNDYNVAKDAIARYMQIEETSKEFLEKLNAKKEKLEKISVNAKLAAQKRVNELLAQGLTREVIEKDEEFIKHQMAFTESSSFLEEIISEIANRVHESEQRQKTLHKFKEQLIEIKKNSQNLVTEKEETLAEVALAKQTESLSKTFNGLDLDSENSELQEVRSARDRIKTSSRLTLELDEATSTESKQEYDEYLNASTISSKLSSLLDWGDKEVLSEGNEVLLAKLPEA